MIQTSSLFVSCEKRAFLGGSQGGIGLSPPGYAQRSALGGIPELAGFGAMPQNLFFWVVFAILAYFDIFSGFLNKSWIKGLGFW
jgi:hypothetical protein